MYNDNVFNYVVTHILVMEMKGSLLFQKNSKRPSS
jgi:hypothetical protein